ncbi:MAG: ribonuclease D [Coriobacteriales bacterium]|nr:ribonuclease D [Coriobacteriales bacterium]
MIIASDEQLSLYIEHISGCDAVAIDTEFIRENSYFPKLCLLQIGTFRTQVVIDVLSIQNFDPLLKLFSDNRVTKIIHACTQDMEVLYKSFGIVPQPIFDTQVAAAFLGWRNQVGYAQLVQDLYGIRLPKSQSLTDWSQRPLDSQQIEYALDDVRYLPQIWKNFLSQLDKKGRISWVTPEFKKLCDTNSFDIDPQDAWKHLKRINSISGVQLSVAREVASWREIKARELDLPRRKLLSDELVVEISRVIPQTAEALHKIRGMDEYPDANEGEILDACRRGLDIPPKEYPEPPQKPKPSVEHESICDLMYALTRVMAKKLGVATTVLASRDDLEDVLKHPETSVVMNGWRYDILGCKLKDLLSGQIGLTVVDGQIEIL